MNTLEILYKFCCDKIFKNFDGKQNSVRKCWVSILKQKNLQFDVLIPIRGEKPKENSKITW